MRVLRRAESAVLTGTSVRTLWSCVCGSRIIWLASFLLFAFGEGLHDIEHVDSGCGVFIRGFIARREFVAMRDIGIVSGLARILGTIRLTNHVDFLILLPFHVFGGGAIRGQFYGFVAVLLQRLDVGGKAAEHIDDFGVFFGLGGELADGVGIEEQ